MKNNYLGFYRGFVFMAIYTMGDNYYRCYKYKQKILKYNELNTPL